MKTGIVLLNFGEPEDATPESVIPFLERIFMANASLDDGADKEEVRRRSRALAERRGPGLVDEYREIGGSPLIRQATEQAEGLRRALATRGHTVATYVGMQFTEPSIRRAAESARGDGVSKLVALPVYPLCGQSTTVAALEQLVEQIRAMSWEPELNEISGWHRHPEYVRLRAENIRAFADARGVDLHDGATRLVYSAHGTPVKYLESTRYLQYVEESCRQIASHLGVADYVIGYQNHANRGIEWTRPDVDAVIRGIEARHVVVVPISFMHEQSETLAELDIDLREVAEAAGLAFHRVPVPHADARFFDVLADLVEPFLGAAPRSDLAFGACRCRSRQGTLCLNSGTPA